MHTVGTGSARVRYPRLGVYAVISALFGVLLIGGRIWAGTSIAVTVAAIGLLAMPKAAEALEDFDITERARIRASKTAWDHMLGDFGRY